MNVKYDDILVSIVVGIYNGEKYLEECLESIRKQTHTRLEVFLIDDGSTDQSGSICSKYVSIDSRFKYYKNSNHGVSYSRNFAISLSTGEYLAIVDQDDCLSTNYIDYFLSLMIENDAEIATTNKVKKFVGHIEPKEVSCSDFKVIDGNKAAKNMLLYNYTIAPWNKLIKMSIIKNNSITFVENFFCGEGFAFSIETFQNSNRVVVGEDEVYLYRIDNTTSGTSSFTPKKLKSSLDAQEYMSKVLYDKTDYAKHVLRYSRWHTCCDFFNLLIASHSENKYRDEYHWLKKECRKEAFSAFGLPIKKSEKIKAILFLLSPKWTGKHFAKTSNKKAGGKFDRK